MKRTGTDVVFGATVATAVAITVLPLARVAGARDSGPPWADYLSSWGFGTLIVVAAGVLGGLLLRDVRPRSVSFQARWIPITLAVFASIGSYLAAAYSFGNAPHLIDEMAQLFQARTYVTGALAAPAPAHGEFFLLPNTFIAAGGWISQYPPGGSVALAVGMLLGSASVVNPFLAGVSTLLVHRLASNLADAKTALIATLLWASSPWVLSMSATYMNHVSATALALAVWALYLVPGRRAAWQLCAAGIALAACAATRSLDAIIALFPVAIWYLAKDRSLRSPLLMISAGLPVIAALLYVNWSTMGDALAVGYIENFGAAHRPGFHVDPFGNPFTPADGFANLSSGLRRLNIYLFEWPVPALLPLLIWGAFSRGKDLSDAILLAGAFGAPFVYLFYFHSGFHPGPRFYYLGTPFLVIGTARAAMWMLSARGVANRISLRHALATALCVTWVWGTIGIAPGRFAAYRQGLSNLKAHPERELESMNVNEALVLVPESWGSRVMARMWGHGVDASLAERAYRHLDLCELDSLVTAYGPLGTDVVSRNLETRLTATDTVPLAAQAPDPTTRLRTLDGLPDDCVRELRRDLAGFAVYPPFGWRNSIGEMSGVVFARDLFEFNEPLLRQWGDRPVWRYAPPEGFPDSLPRLVRLR